MYLKQILKLFDFKSQRGVTLTELSVSVIVVTLMIAGTFGGITIIKAAKIRKATSEFSSYMSAINEFEQQYDYYPGDLPTASSFWSAAPAASNGDGDGLVESTAEDLLVWQHLGKAKLIPGTYTGATAGTYVIGTNSTNSEAFVSGVFSFFVHQTLVYNTAGHALGLGSLVASMPTGGVMLAKDAYSIDKKLDDGLAATGMFYTTQVTTGCTSAASSAATATYVLSDATNVTCRLYYWDKKF